MSATIKFDQHDFTVSTLTEFGVVTPLRFDIQETKTGIIATATECALYGDGRRPYPGEISISIAKTSSQGLKWQVAATMSHLIKGVKVKVAPVSGTSLIEAGGNWVEIENGKGYSTVFPMPWGPSRYPQSGIPRAGANCAQYLFLEGDTSLHMLSSHDYPPRFQRYWAFRKENHLELTVYLEAHVNSRPKQIQTPQWLLEPVADHESGIQQYQKWVQQTYDLKPIEQRSDTPSWVNDICLNIAFHCHANHGRVNVTFSDIETILKKTRLHFDPAQTQLHIVGWDGPWDMSWPAFQPGVELGGADGLRQMIQAAHHWGYKVSLHMNVMGLSYQHPQFAELQQFLQYQRRDSQNRPMNWEHDLDGDDQDELIFAYISPDAPEWRNYLIEQILNFVETYKTDIVHLDQSTEIQNDRRYNHLRGVTALFQELRDKLPDHVALAGEYVNELVANLYPLCGSFPTNRPRLQRSLFAPFVRAFDYGLPFEPTKESLLYDAFERDVWQSETFYENLHMAEAAGLVPTLLIGKPDVNLESQEAHAVFAAARRFRDRVITSV